MRGELPSAFVAAKDAESNRPVNLLVFKFASGTVYLSDRDLGAADGLSHDHLGLVREWGELSDLPLDEEGVSETRELAVTLWNGGTPPFSDHFQEQDPESVEVELWQWFEGTPEEAAVLIDTFTVADPITYDEAGQELRLDLVTVSVKADQTIGELIEAEDYPNAPEESIGKVIPLVFGTAPGLPCNCIDAPAECTLAATILPTDKTILVDDASLFPASGVIQIDDERLLYRSRTDTSFSISARGYAGTVATDHLSGRKVAEVAPYVFAACKGPVAGLSNVKVDGLSPESGYTLQPEADPATITFDGPPRVSTVAEAARYLEMQFDAVADGNTALKPELAFDDSRVTSAAEINRDHRELRLKQTTVNSNRGEIRKVWLGVEHWESERLPHDYVEVEVSGVGVVGRLAAPHPADATRISADVDIDHGHDHSFVAEHTHAFTDRNETLREEAHTHGNSDPVEYVGVPNNNLIKGWAYSFDTWGNKIYWAGQDQGQYVTVTFSGVPGTGKAWLEVTAKKCPVFLGQYPRGTYTDGRLPDSHLGGGDKLLDTDCQKITYQVTGRYSLAAPVSTIYLSAEKKYCWNATYGYAEIVSVKQFVVAEAVKASKTGISLQVVDPGRNLSVEPLTGKVTDLATNNRPLQNIQVETSPRSSVDYFDLTKHVAGNWGWFTGKELRVRYVGSQDGRTVYLLHCWFEVEYSPREIGTSMQVTCDVDGLIDDAAGTITGTPGRRIRRPDEVRKHLLVAVAGLDASKIDSESFGAAGARYNALGYRFDYALTAQTTLKELERRLARQCRSRWYWDGGRAKIAVRERDADLAPVRHITADMVLLDSMSAERTPIASLANRIRLFYRKNLGSAEEGPAGYLASKRGRNQESIATHGLRERQEDFLFDAVREPGMAADLLSFYLEKESRIRTVYTFDAFLDVFELEKEDAVRLTHPFDSLSGHIGVVRAASRVLGSGEAQRPDLVRVALELLPRRKVARTLQDAVRHLDGLGWQKGRSLVLAETVLPMEALAAGAGVGLASPLACTEAAESLRDFDRLLPEAAAPDEDLRLSLTGDSRFIEAFFCEETLTISVSGDEQAALGEQTAHAESLSCAVGFSRHLADTAQAADSLSIQFGSGFGLTPYGTSPYGR